MNILQCEDYLFKCVIYQYGHHLLSTMDKKILCCYVVQMLRCVYVHVNKTLFLIMFCLIILFF